MSRQSGLFSNPVNNKKKLSVFYAWQTDLPSKTNRTFIEESLTEALDQLNRTANNYEFVLSKDTLGQVGTPHISDSILDKIRNCYIFVGDVTIVNSGQLNSRGQPSRLMPNPNVFFECGFAVSQIGWERVIFLANKAFGDPDGLPFDIRHRRISTYDYKAPDLLCVDDKSTVSTAARNQTPNILTKESGVWKFYIVKDNGTDLEDYSSHPKFKQFINRLNKNEAAVVPSMLRSDLVNELKGIINNSKKSAKSDLTKLFVTAIGDIHKAITLDMPRQFVRTILNTFMQHNINFLHQQDLQKYETLEGLLADLAKHPDTPEEIEFTLFASLTDLQKSFINISNLGQYLRIQSFAGIIPCPGGTAYHYKITFLPEFFKFFDITQIQSQSSAPNYP